jgi:hypothetical protein
MSLAIDRSEQARKYGRLLWLVWADNAPGPAVIFRAITHFVIKLAYQKIRKIKTLFIMLNTQCLDRSVGRFVRWYSSGIKLNISSGWGGGMWWPVRWFRLIRSAWPRDPIERRMGLWLAAVGCLRACAMTMYDQCGPAPMHHWRCIVWLWGLQPREERAVMRPGDAHCWFLLRPHCEWMKFKFV